MTPDELVSQLPDTLEYIGEFGTELICFVPFIHWLHVHGRLGHRRVITYSGMRPFYHFLDVTSYQEKRVARHYVPRDRRPTYLPNRGEMRASKNRFEIFPDYRRTFGGRFGRDFAKPLLVVHNKHCNEWGFGPVNFIAIESLDQLFETLKERFQIVYLRDGFGSLDLAALGFSRDHNLPLPFDDTTLLRRHSEVISFERLAIENRGRLGYNELKLRVFADCRHFISSQGGGNYLAAIMGGNLIVILHRAGYELRNAYMHGFYRYAADPAPTLLIARNTLELEEAAGIFQYRDGAEDAANLPETTRLIEKFQPEHSIEPNYKPTRPVVW